MLILWLFLTASSLGAQTGPVLRGGVQQDVGPTVSEVFKDKDPETGQGITQNELTERGGAGRCPELRPPAILVFHNQKTRTCYYWIPNPPDQQAGKSAPPQEVRPPLRGGTGATAADNPRQNRNSSSDPRREFQAYVYGVAEGAAECIKGFGDMLAGVGLLLQNKPREAAKMMGLAPGQSVTLQLIRQEIEDSRRRSNMSAEESGKVAGRRFCLYGLLPAAAKAVKGLPKRPTTGVPPIEPLKTSGTFTKVVSEAPASLAGQAVKGPKGAILRLGNFIGNGKFGAVFEDAANPKQVIKISNVNPESPASFPRQLAGSRVLQQAGIPTPAIRNFLEGGIGDASFMVMDHINTAFPKAIEIREFSKLPVDLRNQVRLAADKLYTDIAKLNYIWPDGHLGNLAFEPVPGGLRAIVIDADFLTHVDSIAHGVSGAGLAGDVLFGALEGTPFQEMIFQRNTAAEWMNALRQVRFPADNVPTTGTVVK